MTLKQYAVETPWVQELSEFLRIPSISADVTHSGDVRHAAEWLALFIRNIGGYADLVETDRHPLVVGKLCATSHYRQAPTVLLYGHFDVQPTGDPSGWISPPFDPTVRDNLLTRAAQQTTKATSLCSSKATEQLADEGRLPINVVFACDGEEECGGHSVARYVERELGNIDAAIIFDGPMPAHDLPAFKLNARPPLLSPHSSNRSTRSSLRHVRWRRSQRTRRTLDDARFRTFTSKHTARRTRSSHCGRTGELAKATHWS